MEVLKNLSEAELTSLRDRFLNAENHALDLDEFDAVLTAACASKPSIDVSKLHLRELFNDIDINGDNTVSWDEFTMFLISGEPSQGGKEDEKDLKRYNHVKTIVGSEIPNSVVETRYIPKLDKALRIMRREKSSRLRLCYPHGAMATYLEVPRSEVPILSAEYIPLTNEVMRSGTMAVSYSDSVVRFYDTKPSVVPGSPPKEMPLTRETKLLESQTVMRWSTRFNRLVMGSRTGVVSVLDIDQPTVSAKEKLHNLLVSDMALADDAMFTASLDAVGSVKCVDLQKSVVKFSLDGHAQGATTLAVSNYHNQLFTAGFELFVLAYAIALPRLKPYKLDDQHRSHKGRIVGVQAVPGSPQVITADSFGLIKVWDLRMYSCVQNIMPSKDDCSDGPSQGGITSIGFLPTRRRLVANGRDTTLYEYDEAGDPHLSDDFNCTSAVYNPKSHSFLSVHDNNVKLWDADTGAPRQVQRAVVPTDITCICLATPLCRRFFAGTIGGQLYSMGYAMGNVLRVYDDIARRRGGVGHKNNNSAQQVNGGANNTATAGGVGSGAGIGGGVGVGSSAGNSPTASPLGQSLPMLATNSPSVSMPTYTASLPYSSAIISLHYMEAFRDTDHQYVVVGMKQEVALVPDAEEHVQRSILSLHCLDEVLVGTTTVQSVAVIHSNFVVVSTSDGALHAADLTSFALVFSYSNKSTLKGELNGLWVESLHDANLSHSSALCFVADATGNTHCLFAASAARWTLLQSWMATGHHTEMQRIAAEGGAAVLSSQKGDIGGSASNRKLKGSRRRRGKGGKDAGSPSSDDAVSPRRRLSTRLMPSTDMPPNMSRSSVVEDYFRNDRHEAIYTTIATCMDYNHAEGLLLVADDRGYVAVWDVSELAVFAVNSEQRVGGAAMAGSLNRATLSSTNNGTTNGTARGAPAVPAPPARKPPTPMPTLIKHWACHDDEILSIRSFERDDKLFVLTTCCDKTIKVSSLDGASLGNLAQGRTELDQAGVPSKHILPFLVTGAPDDCWSNFEAYNTRKAGCAFGAEEGSMVLTSSAASVHNLMERSTSMHAASLATPRPGSGKGGTTVFLTDVALPQSDTNLQSGSFPQISTPRMPKRLHGLVQLDKLKPSTNMPARRTEGVPPLSHTTLPPIGGTSPRTPRREANAGQPIYPTQIGSAPPHAAYVRSNLCANADAMATLGGSGGSSLPDSPRGVAGGNYIPIPPAQLQATPSLRTPRTNPLSSTAKQYLRMQGQNSNPFETMREQALRTKGSVVLGGYTEPSNRIV